MKGKKTPQTILTKCSRDNSTCWAKSKKENEPTNEPTEKKTLNIFTYRLKYNTHLRGGWALNGAPQHSTPS